MTEKKKRAYKKKPSKDLNEAKKRIKELFESAQEMFDEDSKLSDRYVYLARKIAMKYKIRLSSKLRRQFCHKCYSYLMPGKNCTVRTTGKTITYTCKNCKNYNRIGYK